jgi:spoIIIJ-associated protein
MQQEEQENVDTQAQATPVFTSQKSRECANISEVLPQIRVGVNELVETSCFKIHVVRVEAHDEQSVLVEIDGEDAALLIGKEGYRYKAFSYLLYNWINMKYGLGIRLEIAQFLHNQEEMIENYLVTIIERIGAQGRAQTKPLDGVLIKIALEKLRARFPEKYVGIKTGREGRKFVVVNDFNRKSS